MNENKYIIIDSLRSAVKKKDVLIKSLEGEIEYYKIKVRALEEYKNA